jgi:hypothetical protein
MDTTPTGTPTNVPATSRTVSPADAATPAGADARGIADLETELRSLRQTLAQAREALDQAERRHMIELELLKAEALDLETARLLTEVAVAGLPDPDIAGAVADLRRRKPFLFRRRTSPSAMSQAGESDALESLARQARESGDTRSLLRYLRARRAAPAP